MTARKGRPGDDDRRLPVGERRIGERLAGQLQSTTRTPRQGPRHAWGQAHLVTARSGRVSLTIVVFRCPFDCGAAHRHTASPGFFAGIRSAGCGRGRFVLHAYLERQQRAA